MFGKNAMGHTAFRNVLVCAHACVFVYAFFLLLCLLFFVVVVVVALGRGGGLVFFP